MSRSKTTIAPETLIAPVLPEPDLATTTTSAADRAFLARVMRTLVTVQCAAYVSRARCEGYTDKEHKLGWQLWRAASGQDRPLDHWISEQAANKLELSSSTMEKLKLVDAFENTWFPRIHAIISRVVSRDQAVAFDTAFFQNLDQQPLGPSVVGSVGGLLNRVQSLATSTHPEAAKVLATLVERGLTEANIAKMGELIDELAQGFGPGPVSPANRVEVLAAQQAQMAAMGDLHAWFHDWATTLRPAFNSRECVNLGLSVLRRSPSGDGEVVDDEVPSPAVPATSPVAATA